MDYANTGGQTAPIDGTAGQASSGTRRLQLIDELASTVSDDTPPALSEAWLAEVGRRSAELDAEIVTAESWPQIRERLFDKLDMRRED